jgi:hypothetical protein
MPEVSAKPPMQLFSVWRQQRLQFRVGLASCLLVLILSTPTPTHVTAGEPETPSATVSVVVENGQQLADAVAEFGASGLDTLVLLNPPAASPPVEPPTNGSNNVSFRVLSLANASFAAASTSVGPQQKQQPLFGRGLLQIGVPWPTATPRDDGGQQQGRVHLTDSNSGVSGVVVLDAGMQHDLTPPFQSSTRLVLQNFTMVGGS